MAQVSPATSAIEHRPWQEALAPYARPHVGRSALDLATSVVPYLALSVGMYLLLGVSYPLALVLAAPATGFLLRTYVVFHDCAHGSFLPSKRGNAWLGTALGLLVFAPFVRWRHDHAVHHATSGDLDRRGVGDRPDNHGRRIWRPIAASAPRPTGCSATRRSCSASGRWWR